MKKQQILVLMIAAGLLAGCGKDIDDDSISEQGSSLFGVNQDFPENNTEEITENNDESPLNDNQDTSTEADEQVTETSDVPSEYSSYAELLNQFVHEDNNYFLDVQEAYTYSEGGIFEFGLLDINKDGTEELIVKHQNTFNLLVPGNRWEQADIGFFHLYDEYSGQFASHEGDIGEWYNYYTLNGQTRKFIGSYEWMEDEAYDEATGTYEWYDNYSYTDADHNVTPIVEESYNTQPAKSWQPPKTDWYPLTDKNIEAVLVENKRDSVQTIVTEASQYNDDIAVTFEMCMDRFSDVVLSYATGQIAIAECSSMALYYGETAYGNYELGSFAFYDIDSDSNEELLLSANNLNSDGTIGFCNVYCVTDTGEAKRMIMLDGITRDGKIVKPASDSSIYIDFEVGHFENGQFVSEEYYSILDDGTEGVKRISGQSEVSIDEDEFNAAYNKYYLDLKPIYGFELTLENYAEAFNKNVSGISEVVVKTSDGGVNIRKGPGTEYDTIYNMVPDGTHFWVYGYENSTTGKTWGKVRFGGQEGYISMTQVETVH